jgi:hypothetical protein
MSISDVFVSDRPRPELAEPLGLFAPLIGSWSLVVENFAEDGSVQVTDGEWHFGWALDGRAVTDVWISPSRERRSAEGLDGEWGMTLRFFDPAIGAFRSTWHGPARGWVIPFIGRPTEDGLMLEGELDGVVRRWIFTDITADGFKWRAEETPAGAKEPFVRQRFTALRLSSDQ